MNPVRSEPKDSLSPQDEIYEFGPFVLNVPQHLLLKEGQPVSLTPKTYDILLLFLRSQGRMVGKQELMSSLWPNSFVEESNLTQQISTLRRVLGESAGEQKYLVTVPGRGYRFAVEVREFKHRPSLSLVKNDATLSATDSALGAELRAAEPSLGVQSGATGTAARNRRVLWTLLTGLCLAAIAYLGYRGYRQYFIKPVTPRSLAILPFRNLKQDAASDFLGFSLADAVITKLGYVSALTVRPSSSVEKYRDRVIDIPQVGSDLKVDTLLTGNFIREGDDLRITSQLINVKDQSLLWNGAFDLKYDKLLTVQDHVAQQIVKELALNLPPLEEQRLRANAPVDPIAYEYYLHGVDLYSRNEFAMAIKMLEKSTEIDPGHALGWAQLGRAYQAGASLQFGGEADYEKAHAAYAKALAVAPEQIEAHIFMANLLTDTGRVEQSVPLLREAYNTNPNHPDLLWELGYAYRFGGMLEESVAECERARRLDPGVKLNNSAMNAYLYLGNYDTFLDRLPKTDDVAFVSFYRGLGEYYEKNLGEARRNFDRAYNLDPSMLQAQVGKAISYQIAGERERGLALLHGAEKKLDERGVRDAEAIYKIAQAYSSLGDKQSALRLLRRSVENGFFPYPYMVNDPLLDPLHGEPEFAALMQQAQGKHKSFREKFF